MKNVADGAKTSSGYLLALLTATVYGLFTLLPDSHSLMVAWPWVLVWQVGLLCPILWLIATLWHQRRFPWLGNGLDWLAGLTLVGTIVSTLGAKFPHQALWYSIPVLGSIAALFALSAWLESPQRRYWLLVAQGYLNLGFILVSLALWITQTVLPELARLQKLQQFGLQTAYDFSTLELRNWAPIGHQNYVAGYLLLALPLLIGLSILHNGWRRWLWLGGVGLGLLDLYTTSSRGGWLGLTVLGLVSFGLLSFNHKIPRHWLGLGGIGFVVLILGLTLANNRLRTLALAVLSGSGGGDAYRIINTVIGWRMGSSSPLTGIGLGGVPLLYQKYRPFWAGRESEAIYQLHSTPAQLWAEMGLWGIGLGIGATLLLAYLLLRQWRQIKGTDSILLWSLYGGLLAYSVMSLTDFQLDNLCISGTLVIYGACLASIFRAQTPPLQVRYARPLALTGIGFILVIAIWLIPVHRAWQLSSQGFALLQQEQVELFVDRLTQAQQLAPWEPYYPYQLGWNLGELALTQRNAQPLSSALASLQQGNAVSPYQEFGRSNLAWLLLNQDPQAAMQEFIQSAALVPAKRGLFFGLGLSLLSQGKTDLAVEALVLEGLRHPLFITSPIWRSQLQPLFNQVSDRLLAYSKILEQDSSSSYWQHCRGVLLWWQGLAARQALDDHTPLSQLLLALTEDSKPQLAGLPEATQALVTAWFEPSQREEKLQQAWVVATKTPLPGTLKQELLNSMASSTSFEQWLKQNAPAFPYRHERAGFNVNSRHIDGSIPQDFWIVVDNLVMVTWFAELLPSPVYDPQLEKTLQPLRERLLQKLHRF